MQALRTAIIEHIAPDNLHYDWLIEDPNLPNPKAPNAGLWTARILSPPHHWPHLGRFTLQTLPPHRRLYLHYQGPISGNRGRVRRIAQGHCLVYCWSPSRIVLTLRLNHSKLDLQLTQHSPDLWLAKID